MISFTHSSGTKRSLTTDGIQTTTFVRTPPPPSDHDKYPPPLPNLTIYKSCPPPLTVFKSSTEQSTKLQSSDQKQDFQIKFEV